MKENIQLREVVTEDSKSIARLSGQLGYKIHPDIVREQIETILKNEDHFAFVAEKKYVIVGYIHCFYAIRLTSAGFIEIVGLVVKDTERKKGIGKILVQYAEKHMNDAVTIGVRCNLKRKSAHKFYENLGYLEKKEQKIFEKLQQ